jgi:hypothetical protein
MTGPYYALYGRFLECHITAYIDYSQIVHITASMDAFLPAILLPILKPHGLYIIYLIWTPPFLFILLLTYTPDGLSILYLIWTPPSLPY